MFLRLFEIMDLKMFKIGDVVRVKKVMGEINSEHWKLMAEPQVLDTATLCPLTEDPRHQACSVVGFPYMLSSHDLVRVN